MKKIKRLLGKYRHLLSVLSIILSAVFVLGWIWYSVLPDAFGKTERIIVNDDYSLLTEEITDSIGIRQSIKVKADTRFYGFSANFHIFNRVQHGTVYVDLENTSGEIITSARRDLTSVLDNTFKGFIFDEMQCPEADEDYVIHIYIKPETREDRIALWKSEDTYEGFELEENGVRTSGTIAIQYYTRHTGDDIYGFFTLIASVMVSGLIIAYFMLFVKKCRPENAFAVIALTVGIVFSLFTPICGGPDEYVHFASSYKISNTMLGIENLSASRKLLVRKCDSILPLDDTVNYNSFRFQDMYEGLLKKNETGDELVEVRARTTTAFKPVYMPQALGITIARLMNMGGVQLVLMGRIFNLLFYTIMVWLAIKMTPVFKITFTVCGLLPMCMQLAGNFSYDSYILALSYFFTAVVFSLSYSDRPTDWKRIAAAGASLCMLTPVKAVYVMMALLIFIIPSNKFNGKKVATATKCIIFILAVIVWANMNMSAVKGTLKSRTNYSGEKKAQTMLREQNKKEEAETSEGKNTETETDSEEFLYPYEFMIQNNESENDMVFWDPESDILPNGDSKYYYSVSYILSHIKQTIRLVMNTITTKSGHILQCMIGTRLGEIIVVDLQASWLWFIGILLILLLSVLNVGDDFSPHKGVRKWWGALIFVGVVALSVAACIMWTPINYTTIFGVQGRYFLPAFPLIVVFLNNTFIKLEKNIDGILIYSMLVLDLFVILNVFSIMAVA